MTKCTCGKRVPNIHAPNHIQACKASLPGHSLHNARKIMRGKLHNLRKLGK